MESEMQKLDDMLDELEQHYSLAIYDLQDPSRMKRLFGRVFGKIFKVFFMGPFAKKQIAYNRQVLNTLHNLQETQEGILEALAQINELEAYSRPRQKGVNAVNIREGDELLEAILTDGKSEVLIASRNGRCVRFDESDARPLGRTATGVRGINLDEDDYVIGMV